MPNLKDLKIRIESVKSTRKITKAMQMVAAAKLRKAQEAAESSRHYSEKMSDVLANLSSAMKGKESSSLFKMAVGLIIMAFGFFFMTKASTEVVMEGDEVVQKSAMIWLVLAYLFHTIGELCASPVALSFITELAPVKYAAFMMGAYFAATGLGNKVAGFVGQLSEGAGEFQVFTGIAIFCTLFGILVLLLLKPLKRLTHGAEEMDN